MSVAEYHHFSTLEGFHRRPLDPDPDDRTAQDSVQTALARRG